MEHLQKYSNDTLSYQIFLEMSKNMYDWLDTGWISSAGSYVEKFEKSIKDFTGSKYAVACIWNIGLKVSLNLLVF